MTDGLAKAIVELDEDILLACVIKGGEVTEVNYRQSVPIPNEYRAAEMSLQTTVLMSIVLKGQDYMGKFHFLHFHMENADGLYFSQGHDNTLAIMIKPQPISNAVVQKIQKYIEKLTAITSNGST